MNLPQPAPGSSVPSVQLDRFVHDRLPPPEQCPQMRYDLPELQIPGQANLVDVLMAKVAARGLLDRPFLRSDRITLSYADADARINRIAQVLTQDFGLGNGPRDASSAGVRGTTNGYRATQSQSMSYRASGRRYTRRRY